MPNDSFYEDKPKKKAQEKPVENEEDERWKLADDERKAFGVSAQDQEEIEALDSKSILSIKGISHLVGHKVPRDLVTRTKSRWYKVLGFYQVDNMARWKSYTSHLKKSGDKEAWTFYACPLNVAKRVLETGTVIPYSEFFPRVFGEEAIYFFNRASEAARVSLKFGMEQEGLILSCRLITGKIFKAIAGAPKANKLPKGYDSVFARQQTNLGNGPIESDMYAIFDSELALIRYATFIKRK